MSVRDLKKIAGDDISNRSQDNTDTVLRPIVNSAIIDGVLLNDIELTYGANTIEHKLGRKLLGYIVVRKNNDAVISDAQDTNKLSSKNLILYSDTLVTVSLWCF